MIFGESRTKFKPLSSSVSSKMSVVCKLNVKSHTKQDALNQVKILQGLVIFNKFKIQKKGSENSIFDFL